MNELDRARNIALKGPEVDRALEDFRRQIAAWNVALPPVEPLVLDFGLKQFAHTGLIECWIANETDAGYCGKYMFVFDGQTCPLHCHGTKHETFFVVRGRLAVEHDGARLELSEGDVLPIEPGKYHSFTGIGPTLVLELSMPCHVGDNYFDNPDIPIGGNCRRGGGQMTLQGS